MTLPALNKARSGWLPGRGCSSWNLERLDRLSRMDLNLLPEWLHRATRGGTTFNKEFVVVILIIRFFLDLI